MNLALGQGVSPEAMAELRWTTDLALRTTKQSKKTFATIGQSMAAIPAMKKHLYVNLTDIEEKEKKLLLNVLVLPFKLFGTSVEMVVGMFREVKVWSTAIKRNILCGSRSVHKLSEGPGPS